MARRFVQPALASLRSWTTEAPPCSMNWGLPVTATLLSSRPPTWPGSLLCLGQIREIKKQANEVRNGNILDLNGRLFQVTKFQHTQGSGRQLGNVQLELRDLKLGTKSQDRKRPYDLVEVARLDARPFQFLYAEGSQLHFMDPNTFEQETVDRSLFGDQAVYLKEGCDASLNFHQDTVVSGEVPQMTTLAVRETEPYAKGDSASSTYKPAVLETGAKIGVPPYVVKGEQVVVDTTTHTFVKRAK